MHSGYFLLRHKAAISLETMNPHIKYADPDDPDDPDDVITALSPEEWGLSASPLVPLLEGSSTRR